jgi:hypothetical protein
MIFKPKAFNRSQDGITVFTERPSEGRWDGVINALDPTVAHRISARELFSLFTANIIKEKVIFTR